MKLNFDIQNKTQPDPFIFEDAGKFYLYVTAIDGVEAYSSGDIFGQWKYEGIVTDIKGKSFWAPSVIKLDDKYYMYVSFDRGEEFEEFMHVASSDSPLGPFKNEKLLYDRFSIDSHAVKTSKGIYLWYAENSTEGERIGTRVFVDRLLDPETPENLCVEKIVPTFDEEIFTPSAHNNWHTIEGPLYFREGDWHYVMYSGGCYQDDTYHIGYASAKSDEEDLTKVSFEKHTLEGAFDPVMIKNDFEEGTGHHSVIKYKGEYYAIYHGRDLTEARQGEARTARICRLEVKDGKITAKRYQNKI